MREIAPGCDIYLKLISIRMDIRNYITKRKRDEHSESETDLIT